MSIHDRMLALEEEGWHYCIMLVGICHVSSREIYAYSSSLLPYIPFRYPPLPTELIYNKFYLLRMRCSLLWFFRLPDYLLSPSSRLHRKRASFQPSQKSEKIKGLLCKGSPQYSARCSPKQASKEILAACHT